MNAVSLPVLEVLEKQKQISPGVLSEYVEYGCLLGIQLVLLNNQNLCYLEFGGSGAACV